MKDFIKKIKIQDPYKNYNIVIGNSIIGSLSNYINFENYSGFILLTEKKIFDLWSHYLLPNLPKNIKVFKTQTGEGEKNINNIENITKFMLQNKMDRKTLFINFGGGMISDLGGLSASLYMRGVDFINIPTTLLAMVDASIGGKVAVNIDSLKNMIGTFNSPSLVFIDTKFLETLEYRETVSANAEIVKHGIIFDADFFNFTTNNSIDIMRKKELIEIIEKSSIIKKKIVEADFREQNIRKSLNFGHTVGHAFETLSLKSEKPLLHGESVAIGMIIEAKISNFIGLITDFDLKNIISTILYNGFNDIVKSELNFSIKEIINLIYLDKKNEDRKIYMALPTSIGKCSPKIEIDEHFIEKAILEFFEKRESYH